MEKVSSLMKVFNEGDIIVNLLSAVGIGFNQNGQCRKLKAEKFPPDGFVNLISGDDN